MSRKDYEKIAAVIASHPRVAGEDGFVRDMASMLAQDNPRFEVDRFRMACQGGLASGK